MPTHRSQRTLRKPATVEERIDHRDMDREEESADTKTYDEYSPGERYQPSTYLGANSVLGANYTVTTPFLRPLLIF